MFGQLAHSYTYNISSHYNLKKLQLAGMCKMEYVSYVVVCGDTIDISLVFQH